MRRKQLTLMALVAALIAPNAAHAQLDDAGDESSSSSSGSSSGGANGFGVGVETVLTAPFAGGESPFSPAGAATLSYDAGNFRVDGLLFLLFQSNDPGSDSTAFALGARAFYKLHSTSKADFSVGGGLVLGFLDTGPGDADFRIGIDGAIQIRVWLASNVALNASAGIGFAVGGDPFVFALGGQLTGGFGLIYYFD